MRHELISFEESTFLELKGDNGILSLFLVKSAHHSLISDVLPSKIMRKPIVTQKREDKKIVNMIRLII